VSRGNFTEAGAAVKALFGKVKYLNHEGHEGTQRKGGLRGGCIFATQGEFMPIKERKLEDLVSIGPAMLRDFELLGVGSVAQLSRRNPEKLYEKLCQITGQAQDICCLDVFRAAIAQARNPLLPLDQCQWWYWSRRRKARDGGR